MAIAMISRPQRAGSTVRYLLGPVDHAGNPREIVSVVASTIGREPDMAVKFLNHVAKLRPRLKSHLYHVSISGPQTDRELSPKDWAGIGRMWCAGMRSWPAFTMPISISLALGSDLMVRQPLTETTIAVANSFSVKLKLSLT